jgi:hypothetical protein
MLVSLLISGSTFAVDNPATPAGYDAIVAAAAAATPLQADVLLPQAVALRVREGLDEIHAKIAVHRDIALRLVKKNAWADAGAELGHAVSLAQPLGEPQLLLDLLLLQARCQRNANDPQTANRTVRYAGEVGRALDRPAAVIEAELLRAELLFEMQDYRALDETYAFLFAQPGADLFRLELHRARHTRSDAAEPAGERWARVLALARTAGRPEIEAEALDKLGRVEWQRHNPAEAARDFAAAGALAVPLDRSIPTWLDIIEVNSAIDNRAAAGAAIEKAFTLVDPDKEPGRAAVLHEARGDLLGRAGDFAAGYRDLQRANELRRKFNAGRQSVPLARMAPAMTPAETLDGRQLAAVRTALREAELERARLQQRQTFGIATLAVLVAALLGLGYAYKRRTAASLALARDAAELRAERTRWQMLRYQLSPHFLFNALTSLGGLVVTDPPAAGRVVDRLSEFCQLALEGAGDDLRSVGQELKIIRAYLDVEQAGHGDSLRVTYAIDDRALAFRLPPLLLQPLVENALKYGAQTAEELLELRLSLHPDGAGLLIEVANTGRWLEPAALPRRREAVGLANVRERLARLGAGPEALTVQAADGWVRVVVRLPRLAATLPARPA